MIEPLFVDIGFERPKDMLRDVMDDLDPQGYMLTIESMLGLSLKYATTFARDCQRKIAFKVPTTSSLLLRDVLPLTVALGADPIIFPSVRGLGRVNMDRFLNELQKCRELIRMACNLHQIPMPKIWLDEAVLRRIVELNIARGLGFDGYVMMAHDIQPGLELPRKGEFKIVGYCDDGVSAKKCLANGADVVIVKVHTLDQCIELEQGWYHSS